MTARHPARAMWVAAAAASLAACGVQLDDAPRDLAVESVPYRLLEPATTTSSSEPKSLPRFQATSVYLVDNEGFLVEVNRQLPGKPTVESALLSLLSQPSDPEGDSGLGTSIASSTVLHRVTGPQDGLVTVDLSSEVSDVSPDSVRLALAQIVYTATAVPGVDKVLFQVDGEPRQVPDASGQSTAEPLTRASYREFLRPPPTTTTPTDTPPDPPGS